MSLGFSGSFLNVYWMHLSHQTAVSHAGHSRELENDKVFALQSIPESQDGVLKKCEAF